jgi:large subunit ribosomal protein L24
MKLKKGDNVLITAGKDKGRTGKIIKALPKLSMVLVEGINLKKKHVRPRKEGEKGQVVQIPKPLEISAVKMVCPKCGKVTRVGYSIEKVDGKSKKFRLCKQCKQKI